MNNLVMPTAEPFFFRGGSTGCLLIHGFTGTPKEMRWMGEFMSKEGFTVLGIRLAGHATDPKDIARMRWWDWVASVEDGIHILKGACDSIYTIGLSMGGILSLIAASRYPIDGAIAISPPYTLPSDWRLAFLRPLSLFIKQVGKGKPDWKNPDAAQDHVEYPYYSTAAVIQLRELLKVMQASLPEIHIPTLLIHSKLDGSVDPSNQEMIFTRVGSPLKERMMVEKSGHVIIREPDRELAFKASADFIRRVNKLK